MEQYPTKDLTIDPQVAEDAIKRLAPEAVDEIGVDRLRTVRRSYVNTLAVRLMMKSCTCC